MRYEEYIGSSKWRSNPARVHEMASADNRCRVCFAEGSAAAPLEAHHATYERFGAEITGDLIALCHACHVEVTCFLRRRRYALLQPLRADARRLGICVPLFDPTRSETIR